LVASVTCAGVAESARRWTPGPKGYPFRRVPVEPRPHRRQKRVGLGELLAVFQIELVVEIGGVLPLVVLHDRFQLVERLGELGLLRCGCFVLVPEIHNLLAHARWERGHQLDQAGSLLPRLVSSRGLRGSRDVTAQGFAQIVNDADPDQLGEIDVGIALGEDESHEAEPPGMLGDALSLARRGPAAAENRLQSLGGSQKREGLLDFVRIGEQRMLLVEPQRDSSAAAEFSLSAVFQFLPEPRVPSFFSINATVNRERPIPSG
jgi:hypothetical protein